MSVGKIKWLRIALCVTAAMFIAFGIVRGETDEVVAKAVHLCLECIGIG